MNTVLGGNINQSSICVWVRARVTTKRKERERLTLLGLEEFPSVGA